MYIFAVFEYFGFTFFYSCSYCRSSLFFFFLMIRPPPSSTLFPYPTLSRSPLPRVTRGPPDQVFVPALMYERRFSLLWERGTRWIAARRFGRLTDIPLDVPSGSVPPVMPIPKGECDARNLTASEVIPDVVTCQPPLAP